MDLTKCKPGDIVYPLPEGWYDPMDIPREPVNEDDFAVVLVRGRQGEWYYADLIDVRPYEGRAYLTPTNGAGLYPTWKEATLAQAADQERYAARSAESARLLRELVAMMGS